MIFEIPPFCREGTTITKQNKELIVQITRKGESEFGTTTSTGAKNKYKLVGDDLYCTVDMDFLVSLLGGFVQADIFGEKVCLAIDGVIRDKDTCTFPNLGWMKDRHTKERGDLVQFINLSSFFLFYLISGMLIKY